MKKALQDEKSPLDANLESVLPGVHQWQQANFQAVNRLNDRVDAFAEVVATGINTLITKLDLTEQQRAEQHNRLAQLLEFGSHVLRNGPSAGCARTSVNTLTNGERSPVSAESPAGETNDTAGTALIVSEDEDVDRHKTYRMRPRHQRLIELYQEWIGAGDFQDDHGGIEGRNKKFGAKWRQHLTTYVYSRTERTIKGIRAYADRKGISAYDACEQLQEQYEKHCKCSVANMVTYFTSKDLLTKRKPRGKARAVISQSP
jgi:Transcriptional activator of glycolytic enzymes